MAIVSLPKFKVNEKVEVTIKFPPGFEAKSSLIDGVPGKLARLRRVIPLLNSQWPKEWSPDNLVEAVQTGNRISLNPKTALQELEKLERSLPEVIDQITKLNIDKGVINRALAHLDGLVKK